MSLHNDDDDKGKKKDPKKEGDSGSFSPGFSDSGLGNLPPLSDFDSTAGQVPSDAGLPAINFSSDSGQQSFGGLPPISDIPVETPVPTGGNVRPSPPGFEDTPMFDTPMTDSGFGLTPGGKGTAFQDLAADSDFTPETPEIGPGPDSDLDTPMFDSAFGAGASRMTTPDTTAPTQAMETPMFGARPKPPASSGFGGDALGFDDDASFGMTTGTDTGFGGGTPIPDLSPDTFAGTAPPATPTPAPPGAKKAKSGGGHSVLVTVALCILGLVIGIVGSPFLADYLKFLPNPLLSKIDDQTKTIAEQKQTITDLTKSKAPGEAEPLTQEQINRLIKDRDELTSQITNLTNDKGSLETQVASLKEDQATLEGKIEALNQDFAQSQQQYEELLNQTAIVRARRDGLDSEVERLQSLVGKLDEANNRSIATKDTLLASVEQLASQIHESMPLTPSKYAYEDRVKTVDDLKEKVSGAKWVEPSLVEEYTSLYLKELQIAGAREYFFARIPVTDRFGATWQKWAECVMNGNWSVYYRTLDGKNIGSYTNAAPDAATPKYAFNETLPPVVQKQIEDTVIGSRSKNFEDTIRVLAQKEEVTGSRKTSFQRAFDSL